ncbi:hypothetical protein [Roseomonas chloroacetimidivorans]|uniref:hypothetical protein n=1 Tax=Roseomonas chloroacetimidivorans TaxID=1766656 RepID=UPI003C720D81
MAMVVRFRKVADHQRPSGCGCFEAISFSMVGSLGSNKFGQRFSAANDCHLQAAIVA